MRNVRDLTCAELVELVTEYLEESLPPDEAARFEEHLRECPGCREYVDQLRTTIALTGRLRADGLTPAQRDGLLAAFRGYRRQAAR